MRTKFNLVAVLVLTCFFASCGTSKKAYVDNNYYSNPQPAPVAQQVTPAVQQPTLTKRAVREVDKLAAAETDKLRAVGVGNDFEEKEARSEALGDAQTELATFLETSIVALITEYHNKAAVNGKKFSESSVEGTVERAVAQVVSVKPIGEPEVYDASDGSIQVYRCVELTKPTGEVVGEVYDQLTREGVLGVEYDKMKFIKDNEERLKELRSKVE